MGLTSWLIDDEEAEQDRKLLDDVVKYYQPSMRVVGRMLTMSASEGRRTARTYGYSEPIKKN